jgi:hypothetical protein
VQFTVLFARNVERDLVADENRRDLRWSLAGGWALPKTAGMVQHVWIYGRGSSTTDLRKVRPRRRLQEWLVPFVPRAAYYGFGEVRVAMLALLIFTALSG